MIFSFWETGDYPILLHRPNGVDPWPELVEFNQRIGAWDTLRVCVDGHAIGVGSGHGNTHDSINRAMVAQLETGGLPETYIMFYTNQRIYFNLEDVSGEREVRPESARPCFSDNHWDILNDLMKLRDDA